MVSLPPFPTLRLSDLTDGDLTDLAAWLDESTRVITAERARRAAIRAHVDWVDRWKITAAGLDDPRWTPQDWDAARFAAGPRIGLRGWIVGRCTCGCEQVDGQPRWLLYIAGDGLAYTCVPRAHLRPAPAVRREGSGIGRTRCDYDCLCCVRPRRSSTGRGHAVRVAA